MARTYRVGVELPNVAGGFARRDMTAPDVVTHLAAMTNEYGAPTNVLTKWHERYGYPVACFTFHKGCADEQRIAVHGLTTIDCR